MDERLKTIILSNPRHPETVSKIKIRPIQVRQQLLFQQTRYVGTQVLHQNLEVSQVLDVLETELAENFKQCEVKSLIGEALILVSKKGKMTFKKKLYPGMTDAKADCTALLHNKEKQYILQEGRPVEFLQRLGVQTADGKIHKAKYDKFRQINRYLEFIQDVLEELPGDRTIRIIDFGCGKSYLTFAMYYYLHVEQGRDLEVTGLDLKKDVIAHCNEIATDLGFTGLHFEQGDIQHYNGTDNVDLVVSLHACDTATDYAIAKAVKWNAKVIMAVPCCQHELNRQMHCKELESILQYGLIKERVAALFTDALRANRLEQAGYDTQILEFIDMEHTPKNLLIRAVKSEKIRPMKKGVDQVEQFLGVKPTLTTLLERE